MCPGPAIVAWAANPTNPQIITYIAAMIFGLVLA
jgi:hypothetical protein